MSIYDDCESIAQNQYRDRTERLASTKGVMAPSFCCKRCGLPKLTTGRKQLVKGAPKFGYVCAECATSTGS